MNGPHRCAGVGEVLDRVRAMLDGPGFRRAQRTTRPGPADRDRAMVVVVSGIDASGKGHVAGSLACALAAEGVPNAIVHIDPWLNPPGFRERRGPDGAPARGAGAHFLDHAFDFERVFASVVRPLRASGSVDLTVSLSGQSGVAETHVIRHRGVRVVIVEGVFLIQPGLRKEFDLAVWVDCSFETALERAKRRDQEGLPEREIVRDYLGMYFPAQQEHLLRHDPRRSADLIVHNDDPGRVPADRGVSLDGLVRTPPSHDRFGAV